MPEEVAEAVALRAQWSYHQYAVVVAGDRPPAQAGKQPAQEQVAGVTAVVREEAPQEQWGEAGRAQAELRAVAQSAQVRAFQSLYQSF